MKNRDTFIFYRSIFESAKVLPQEERLEFYEAVMQFSLDFKEPKLSGMVGAMFTLLRPTLDKSNKGYIAGKKAGHPKHPVRVVPKHPTDNKDKDKDKDKYSIFIDDLKSKCSIPSKVTKTKEGKKIFNAIENIDNLIPDYCKYQLDKKEFSIRITAYMEDYKTTSCTIGGFDYDRYNK